jgi:hypothetical protein
MYGELNKVNYMSSELQLFNFFKKIVSNHSDRWRNTKNCFPLTR